jgi:nucleoid-associated protein YgaU
MSSAELRSTTVADLSVRGAAARSLPTRAEGSLSRGPSPAAPITARRGMARPGARPARHDGLAGVRPVRGGCLPTPGGVAAMVSGAPGREPAPLRLTRRGRRLVAVLSLAVGLAVAGGVATVLDGLDSGLQLAGQSSVVVEPGDTLWSIAREVAPQEDTRAVVDALSEVNGLGDTVLIPGQVLQLP